MSDLDLSLTVAQFLASGLVGGGLLRCFADGWCRHHTQSAEKRSLTLKLFMAQFVNTALSSLVANMYIPALYKRLRDTFVGTLIFQVRFYLFLKPFSQSVQPNTDPWDTWNPPVYGAQYVNPSQYAAWLSMPAFASFTRQH